jgi:hypothetical protein
MKMLWTDWPDVLPIFCYRSTAISIPRTLAGNPYPFQSVTQTRWRSAVIFSPSLRAGTGHPGALDQVMAMAYGPKRVQIVIADGQRTTQLNLLLGSIRRWWCSLAGLDSWFLITDVLKFHIFCFHVLDWVAGLFYLILRCMRWIFNNLYTDQIIMSYLSYDR